MSDMDELQQQVAELQSQLAFQDDTLTALNDAVAGQQTELLTLRRQLELLKQRQDEQQTVGDQSAPDSAQEKPPHY